MDVCEGKETICSVFLNESFLNETVVSTLMSGLDVHPVPDLRSHNAYVHWLQSTTGHPGLLLLDLGLAVRYTLEFKGPLSESVLTMF